MSDEPRADLHEGETEGRYANYFTVGFNAFEVVLVFGQFYEGNPQPHLHTRIVTGPAYAKSLLDLFRSSLEQYERTFGLIRTGNLNE